MLHCSEYPASADNLKEEFTTPISLDGNLQRRLDPTMQYTSHGILLDSNFVLGMWQVACHGIGQVRPLPLENMVLFQFPWIVAGNA